MPRESTSPPVKIFRERAAKKREKGKKEVKRKRRFGFHRGRFHSDPRLSQERTMIYLTKIRNDLSLGSKRGAIIAYRESIKSNCDHYPMKLLRFCLISDLPKVLSPKQRALEEKESIRYPLHVRSDICKFQKSNEDV